MQRFSHKDGDGRAPEQSVFTWIVPFVLFLTAIALILNPSSVQIPTPATAHVDPASFAGAFREANRQPFTLVGGFEQRCNSCHRLFESSETPPNNLNQHTQLKHDHGDKMGCYNCHDKQDREKLVLHDGTLIELAEGTQLCAQCHGPISRDWEMGIHGKTMGSWDSTSGLQVRLECSDCHNPHAPAFPPFDPLPAPNTLRIHRDDEGHRLPAKISPLQRWLHEREDH